MKTETRLMYVSFSKYSDNGLSYHVFDTDMREHLSKNADYAFLCEIVIPVVNGADVANMAIDALHNEIADHQVEIENLLAKKQQFLAIEHDGGES
jgi:hypothetical protein